MGSGTAKATDELTEKISDRTEAAERGEMVRGFQDHPDALLLAWVLAVLTGVATRVVRMIRRRRQARTSDSTESRQQAAPERT